MDRSHMNPILRWLDARGILEDARTWADHGMITWIACLPMFADFRVGLVTGGLMVVFYMVREVRQWRGYSARLRKGRGLAPWQDRLDAIMDAAVPLIVYGFQAVALR